MLCAGPLWGGGCSKKSPNINLGIFEMFRSSQIITLRPKSKKDNENTLYGLFNAIMPFTMSAFDPRGGAAEYFLNNLRSKNLSEGGGGKD